MAKPKITYSNLNAYIPYYLWSDLGNLKTSADKCKIKMDSIYSFLHLIYWKLLYTNIGEDKKEKHFTISNWVRINTETLKILLSTSYKKVIDFLQRENVIEVNQSYCNIGKHYPKSYRLHPNLYVGKIKVQHFKKVEITDHCTKRAIYNLKELYNSASLKNTDSEDIHRLLFESHRQLRFNVESFKKQIELV
ncbi:MAG: hypothetical protein J7604_25910 [Sporocytophaga sp.]|uniref:hypothetical protein n=1 Tax=Sporocytophaga sp. TaxID=2231183 RepID=UPI001B1CEEE4|nr:hypothetical protein [Sporocytophaga sp.]MBO9703667.1 hypothetical protein [Sporocytophaga sp.]